MASGEGLLHPAHVSEASPAPAPSFDAPAKGKRARSFGGAVAVASGILLSRLSGFLRERALAYFFGNASAMGAFRAAFRVANLIQNLLGEGALSASFIPVYARLLAEGKEDEANRVARTVGTLVFFAASIIALLGVLFAPVLIEVLAPGFHGPVRALTIRLVRIFFPGTLLLALSAWCLGVLNSHRHFFLSYVSPVLWNGAIIATAIIFGMRMLSRHGEEADLAAYLAWGAVAGAGLQLLAQLPTVLSLTHSLWPALLVRAAGVRATLRAFGPVLIGRGSVQISGYLDQLLASFLGASIVSAMGYSQILALLPVSLFGMSIAAAELPEMSSALGTHAAIREKLHARLHGGLRRIVFLVVPSVVAFVAIGTTLVGAIFQTGRFTAHDTWEVWVILCGSAIGIVAGNQSRLFQSAYYAMGDTKTPLYCALVRVSLTFVAGWALTLPLRAHYGYAVVWGAFGLTASAGVASWVEFSLLKKWLGKKIGAVQLPLGLLARCFGAAIVAGLLSWALQRACVHRGPLVRASLVVPVYGILYMGLAMALRVPEAGAFLRRIRTKLSP